MGTTMRTDCYKTTNKMDVARGLACPHSSTLNPRRVDANGLHRIGQYMLGTNCSGWLTTQTTGCSCHHKRSLPSGHLLAHAYANGRVRDES